MPSTDDIISLDYPVVGVRSWYLIPISERSEVGWAALSMTHHAYQDPTKDHLYSITASAAWESGINVAQCVPIIASYSGQPPCAPALIPNPKCECGFYGYHNVDIANALGLYMRGVLGIVRGWGRIQVHEDGWRAEKAEILALVTDRPASDKAYTNPLIPNKRVRALARKYQVPTVAYQALANVMTEFGKQVPPEMRPKKKTKPKE